MEFHNHWRTVEKGMTAELAEDKELKGFWSLSRVPMMFLLQRGGEEGVAMPYSLITPSNTVFLPLHMRHEVGRETDFVCRAGTNFEFETHPFNATHEIRKEGFVAAVQIITSPQVDHCLCEL